MTSQLLHTQRAEIATRLAIRQELRMKAAERIAMQWYYRKDLQRFEQWNRRQRDLARSVERFLEIAGSEDKLAAAPTIQARYSI